jgi:hypothetical protein
MTGISASFQVTRSLWFAPRHRPSAKLNSRTAKVPSLSPIDQTARRHTARVGARRLVTPKLLSALETPVQGLFLSYRVR